MTMEEETFRKALTEFYWRHGLQSSLQQVDVFVNRFGKSKKGRKSVFKILEKKHGKAPSAAVASARAAAQNTDNLEEFKVKAKLAKKAESIIDRQRRRDAQRRNAQKRKRNSKIQTGPEPCPSTNRGLIPLLFLVLIISSAFILFGDMLFSSDLADAYAPDAATFDAIEVQRPMLRRANKINHFVQVVPAETDVPNKINHSVQVVPAETDVPNKINHSVQVVPAETDVPNKINHSVPVVPAVTDVPFAGAGGALARRGGNVDLLPFPQSRFLVPPQVTDADEEDGEEKGVDGEEDGDEEDGDEEDGEEDDGEDGDEDGDEDDDEDDNEDDEGDLGELDPRRTCKDRSGREFSCGARFEFMTKKKGETEARAISEINRICKGQCWLHPEHPRHDYDNLDDEEDGGEDDDEDGDEDDNEDDEGDLGELDPRRTCKDRSGREFSCGARFEFMTKKKGETEARAISEINRICKGQCWLHPEHPRHDYDNDNKDTNTNTTNKVWKGGNAKFENLLQKARATNDNFKNLMQKAHRAKKATKLSKNLPCNHEGRKESCAQRFSYLTHTLGLDKETATTLIGGWCEGQCSLDEE